MDVWVKFLSPQNTSGVSGLAVMSNADKVNGDHFCKHLKKQQPLLPCQSGATFSVFTFIAVFSCVFS